MEQVRASRPGRILNLPGPPLSGALSGHDFFDSLRIWSNGCAVMNLATKLSLSLFLAISVSTSAAQDFTHARVIFSAHASATERSAIQILLEESERRTSIRWPATASAVPFSISPGESYIVVALRGQISSLLPSPLDKIWRTAALSPDSDKREGFTIKTVAADGSNILLIAGNDSRGLLFGIGYCLRKLEMSSVRAVLPRPIDITTAPQYSVRGIQIGYRFKNNTYDAWTLPMFEQHIRDLAVFGDNTIQLISPESDDAATSPLYPAPALDTLVGISAILAKYGLNCDLYYPELRKDYSDPAAVGAELQAFEALIRRFPRIDSLHVPAGDPGRTPPKLLFALVEKQAAILRRYHPHAAVWISSQGFDRAAYEQLYGLLDRRPKWLTGIFFGPQSRDSFEKQRARIPAQFQMQFYPDIAHTMHSQFPVPNWDPAFALSEGREPINPRPVDETHIYRHFARLHDGFIAYSEGVNDDVNKVLWLQLGWSAQADPSETLDDYSRYFIGPKIGSFSSDTFAEGLFALERNWRGPVLKNTGIEDTLRQFQALEAAASPEQKNNWRMESALYRAYYDAYIRTRLTAETRQEEQALQSLRSATTIGSLAAMQMAKNQLQIPSPAPGAELRAHVFDLADRLFHHVRIQLSVEKYGASGIGRGANLDRIDVCLNDRVWMQQQFAQIGKIPAEAERLARIEQIVHWNDPVPGAIYDDLGDPENEPHLVRGAGFDKDPEMYHSAINGVADIMPDAGWRYSWVTYAETLYEQPMELVYHHLNPQRPYKVRVTYGGEAYVLPIRLVANDKFEIHPPLLRAHNPETLEFNIPAEATSGGNLDLKWTGPVGMGGGGRGHQVAEVWLIPQ